MTYQPALEEYHLENLGNLGHPAAIPFLRDSFDWRDNPLLCTVLYKLVVVNNCLRYQLADEPRPLPDLGNSIRRILAKQIKH